MSSAENDDTKANKVSTIADSMPTSKLLFGHKWMNRLMNKDQKLFAKEYRTQVASIAAGACSTASTFPLDTIKNRMQTFNYSTVRACARETYVKEGLNGFYRGLLAPMFTITMVRMLAMSIYQQAKYKYDAAILRTTGKSPLIHANKPNAWPNLHTIACFGAAGATSGALVTFISCPLELAKLNSQIGVLLVDGKAGGPSSFDADRGRSHFNPGEKSTRDELGSFKTMRKIVRSHGWLGLYSGFHLHMIRDIIGSGVYFTTYESTKQIMANARGKSSTSAGPVALAGASCGLVSWLCIYPIDSAKSIHQRNVLGTPDTPPHEEKPVIESTKIRYFSRRMYRGLAVSVGRSMLVNMIFFSVFEGVKKQVNGLEVDEAEGIIKE